MADNGKYNVPKPEYEVGYGKPPKSGRFKKGKSGNPSGRSKKPKAFGESFMAELARNIEYKENGKLKKQPAVKLIIRRLVHQATTGNMAAFKEIARFLEQYEAVLPTETDEEIARKKKFAEEMVRLVNDHHQSANELALYRACFGEIPAWFRLNYDGSARNIDMIKNLREKSAREDIPTDMSPYAERLKKLGFKGNPGVNSSEFDRLIANKKKQPTVEEDF